MLETIRTRRSIRKFKESPIEDGLIEKILEAGRWVAIRDEQPAVEVCCNNRFVSAK